MKARKPGRPKMELGKAKAVVFHVRVTKGEREAIREAAQGAKSESEWARKILLKNVKAKPSTKTTFISSRSEKATTNKRTTGGPSTAGTTNPTKL